MSLTSRTRATTSSVVLGKRKTRREENLVLRLTPLLSSSSQCDDSDYATGEEAEYSGSANLRLPSQSHMIVNGCLVPKSDKCYCCTFPGCNKSYSKPSRLAEHERSHTGDRPFVCSTCEKSYLRETHLHAHARSHLPQSERPFECEKPNCTKRFWTLQHLQVHRSWHDGAKPYKCHEPDCHEAFAKHHQLRAHICTIHSPPGTKPFICSFSGCSKSFDTNQHLKTHSKTHDDKRYACSQPSCLASGSDSPTYFPTWSALQSHMKKAHPPACPHSFCSGKTFANPGNLRAHLRLHEHREVESVLEAGIVNSDADDDDDEQSQRKRRRGGEHGRDWRCDHEGCDKDFKSKKALTNHVNVNHLGRRDFVCGHAGCGRAFGYKHLLQRHQAKVHGLKSGSSAEESSDPEEIEETNAFSIDTITGLAYAKRSEALLNSSKAVCCPYPNLQGLVSAPDELEAGMRCEQVFTRGYDLRRHLLAAHKIETDKARVDRWVRITRQVDT